MLQEKVVLINEQNQVLGQELKSKVHHQNTPLHRGFSVFIFNSKGQVLLQKRSLTKITWPGVWSNSCCGHPNLNESNLEAAERRLSIEINLEVLYLKEIISDYRYKFERFGIVENEICPILAGFSDQEPKPNPEEVAEIMYLDWQVFLQEVEKDKEKWSEWCREEAKLLQNNFKFQNWFQKYVLN